MRLDIDNGNIINYSSIETFINNATMDNANSLKSLLSEIKMRIGDESVNHMQLAVLAKAILNKCNDLGIGIDSNMQNNSKEQSKRISLSSKSYSISHDRAGKVNVTLIIAGLMATTIMYTLLFIAWILNR